MFAGNFGEIIGEAYARHADHETEEENSGHSRAAPRSDIAHQVTDNNRCHDSQAPHSRGAALDEMRGGAVLADKLAKLFTHEETDEKRGPE